MSTKKKQELRYKNLKWLSNNNDVSSSLVSRKNTMNLSPLLSPYETSNYL
jgi:hypothetical protein